MSNKNRQHNPEDLKRIQALRLIDDDFMSVCFDGYIEGAELLLKIILGRDDLKVTDVKTQKQLNSLQGRSIALDIYATDQEGTKYDVEIQSIETKRMLTVSYLMQGSTLLTKDEAQGGASG